MLGDQGFSTNTGGLANGDSVTAVTLTSAGAAKTAAKGDYDVVASAAVGGAGTELSNYDISYVDGTLSVHARTLTITADDRNKTYGDLLVLGDQGFSTNTGGLANGDSVTAVTLTSAGAAKTAAKGDYDVVASAAVGGAGTELSNYDISYVDGTLSVHARTLTITADDRNKTYGDLLVLGDQGFSTNTGGLVNGDSVTAVTLTSAGAAKTAAKGDYDVVASAAVGGAGTELSNYDISYVDGTLSVHARTLTITADDRNKTYGDLLVLGDQGFSTNTGGLVNGDSVTAVTLTSAGAAKTAAKGDYDVVASAAVGGAGTELSNYDISYVDGTLSVHARTLTITADDRNKTYGDLLVLGDQGFSTNTGGLVNGDSVTAVTLTSAGAAKTAAKGDYDVVASAAVGGAGTELSNYDISYVDGTLSVHARTLTITADDRNKTYGDLLVLGDQGFSTNTGGLVNGDSVTAVTLTSAGGSDRARAGRWLPDRGLCREWDRAGATTTSTTSTAR